MYVEFFLGKPSVEIQSIKLLFPFYLTDIYMLVDRLCLY